MAYTAIEAMREANRARFGRDVGPMPPPLASGAAAGADPKSAALRFLRTRCEGLRFDAGKAAEEARSGRYLGRSLKPGQIPYNMEMDLDRLCLETALADFLDSGTADDAYTVYYCYLEMFFGRYGSSKRMVELLSEYEANGSSLLMKHRDHYSHSVYVFALGLALFETNEAYRGAFCAFYRLGVDDASAANCFLEYWGLTALFHDIGYPFELPFEQVLSYFEVAHIERGPGNPYMAYRGVETLTALDAAGAARFEALFGRRFSRITQLLAYDIAQKLGDAYGCTEADLLDVIEAKPIAPERFGYYMDHAFFSSARAFRELTAALGPGALTAMHVGALSAILLHNSLFKFAIAFYKDDKKRRAPLRPEQHPLAWLLMLCDELQCWDRTAYGRNSRTELHPMAADFDFSGGVVDAVYSYDAAEREKIAAWEAAFLAWESGGGAGKPPRLKAYSDMAERSQRFMADIRRIVDTAICPLTVRADVCPADRGGKHTYLSESNFLHLYDFAAALHGRSMPADTSAQALEEKFSALSLEYQLSGINRAKRFGRYLDAIGCFYTDRPVAYEMVCEITPEQAAVIAPLEHARWVREHRAMGWRYGADYETLPLPDVPAAEEKAARGALREQLRCHRLAMDGAPTDAEIAEHYASLAEADQDKDWKPFNSMLSLLKKFDGLRIYKLN